MIPPAPLGTDAAADRPGLGGPTGAAPQGAAAERRFRFELAAHPGSVAQARRLTQARLTGWSVSADTCDSAALVMSELVTNAIVHTASSRIVCELHDRDDMVRIAVGDEGCAPGEPHPSPQQPDEEHGRGLLLVDALCRAWGAQEHGPGLLVWAELARRADPDRESVEPCYDLGWGARPKPGRPEDSGDDEPAQARQGALHLHRPAPPGRSTPGQHPLETPGQPLQRAPQQRLHNASGEPQHQASESHPEWASEPHRHGTAEHRWYGVPEPRPHPAGEPRRHRSADQPLHRTPEQHRGWDRP